MKDQNFYFMRGPIPKNMLRPSFFIVCMAIWFPLALLGQSLDSLETVLHKKSLSNGERIKIYDDLAWSYTNIDQGRSVDFSKKGLALAHREGDKRMEAIFYKNMAVAYLMGSVYDSAAHYLEKAHPIMRKLGDYRQQASIYNTYGNIYRMQGLYDLTLENYLNAAGLMEAQNDIHGLNLIYSNIAAIYQIMRNYAQSLKYLKKAEKLALETNDQGGLGSVYVSMADIGLYQGMAKEESLAFAEKALEIFRMTDNQFSENTALQTLSKIHHHHGDHVAAEPIAQQALAHAEELGFPKLIAEALIALSNIHFRNGKYGPSAELALAVLKIDSTDTNIRTNVFANLVQNYAYLGNPELSEKYLDNYREALDSYSNESYQSSLSEMEVRYEAEKKTLKIYALEKQRELYIYLGIAVALILLIVTAFVFVRYRLAVNRRKLAEEAAQRLEGEKQLVAVQAAMDSEAAERSRLAKDLHDGLGSMLSLVRFNLPQLKGGGAVLEAVEVSRFQTALGMLDDSIRELRRVAHHMMPESLLRYGLKASLSDFCEAIPIADFHYFGDGSRLSEKLEIMIYRCIHELVNNALKHAGATHINVQLVQEEGRISFTVQDNGTGFDQQQVKEGMGLANVRQRVKAFQGDLNIYSSEQGTEIHVEIEWTKEDKND